MIAFFGVFRRELGRVLAGSATFLALPAGLAWVAWQRMAGSVDPGAVDGPDALFRAAALVLVPLAVWAAAPSFAVERVERTATLWAISPVRPTGVLLGKFLALMTALTLALVVLALPLALQSGPPDGLTWQRLGAGLGGLLLLCAVTVALTLLTSALATHFSTAFIAALALVVAWTWGPALLDGILVTLAGVAPGPWVEWAAAAHHGLSGWDARALVLPLFLGWVDLGAVAALVAAVLVLLVVTQQVVASERWRG
ncbi:MAG: hypothetical protein HZA24_01205 [Nitrospirae bacterium]|nr:hypothetical protein [Nitrospirota bacterium]